jgi:modification methylase
MNKKMVIVNDVMKALAALESESIDVVVTSPPYNLGNVYAKNKTGRMGGKWNRVIQYTNYDDHMPEKDYVKWQQDVVSELWRVIKPTGAIFYNHKPRIQKGVLWDRLNLIPEEATLRQIIVWRRPKGHNFTRTFFVPSYEWIFMLAKPAYKINKGMSGYGDVWELSPAKKNDHPAPFPVDIPLRAISSSQGCKVVLDPFLGSGTTAVAAHALGMEWIGIDIDPNTPKMTDKRIAECDCKGLLEKLKYYK